MVQWWWLIPAAMIGGAMGFAAAALCWISRESQQDQDRMIDERRIGKPPRDYADR